jgi:long-chain acyl-CoA synthetase
MIYVHSLDRAARYYPEQPGLSVNGHQLDFRELRTRVEGIAAALSREGFRPGNRLALLLPNGPEYIELVYACSRLGVVVVPLNTRYAAEEIDRVLADASPHGLVRHSSLPAPTVPVAWQRVLDQDSFEAPAGSCPDVFYDPDAVLALIYTSGTTGRPKGVMLTHTNVLENIHHFNYWMPYREGGVYLHAAPMFHIADFPIMFAAPAFGTRQVGLPHFSPQGFCEAVEQEGISHTVLVPTMLTMLTAFAEVKRYALSSLEVVAYGGSPMPPAHIRAARALLPHVKLVQVYGLSETGFLMGLRDQDHTPERLASCGRPCPGIEVRVVDDAGTPVQSGQRGELVARGANVMHGYWHDPTDTAGAFRNGFFRTGDVGYQDAAGYFYIVDRVKDMIITGGENVYSGEVEAVIAEHPAVREVAVFGLPDPQWGELVAACVVLKPGACLTADELIQYCRVHLAKYAIPRHVEFSDTALPRNSSGKVLKRVLRERFWAGAERAVD